MTAGGLTEKKSKADLTQRYERASRSSKKDLYVLRLYVAGANRTSQRAIANIKLLCDEHLRGRYKLEIVDIYQQPKLAQTVQIVAVPTLVRLLPSPLRRFIGDMSKAEQALLGLGAGPSREEAIAAEERPEFNPADKL